MKNNILLIHTDQHRFDCMGVNGHPILQTPHLDRLANEGVNFTHAFSPIAVCIPARNCLLYGQWSTEHLAIANWGTEAPRPARGESATVSQTLHDAGYHLSHIGKWHIHPSCGPLDYGYHIDVPESDYASWRRDSGFEPKPNTNGWHGEVDPHIPAEASRLAWAADRVIEQIEAAESPFFIHWESNEPHLPNVVPEPFGSMYSPDEIVPWAGFDDPLLGKPYMQAQQRRTWGLDGWPWEAWAPIVARYLGEISLLDAQIGRILDVL
ncbi:MAG: sulfatase-like hydrolase/transferase, partial [Candidatus Latescibacteria bacterium]|nr:sulfatase-like hydrolase/transferase [Candidatus Latescibacterota bacterium]